MVLFLLHKCCDELQQAWRAAEQELSARILRSLLFGCWAVDFERHLTSLIESNSVFSSQFPPKHGGASQHYYSCLVVGN